MNRLSKCFWIGLLCLIGFCSSLRASVFLVSTGSVWRYLDDGSNQGTAWRAPNFDDSAWPFGPAELGFGDGDEATPIRRANYITAYFRHYFVVNDPQEVTALMVGLRRDDGGVVYLNGSNVFRSNIPGADEVNYNTLAALAISETDFYTNAVAPQLLVAGTNVLAVEIHQNAPTSSDISFELYLWAEGNVNTNPPAGITLTAPTNNARLRIQAPAVLSAAVAGTSSVASVSFYAGANLVGTATEAPYSATWTPIQNGAFVLRASASFADGLILTSAPVTATVVSNVLPTVGLLSPANGTFFAAGNNLNVNVSASDSDGTLSSVNLFTNGVLLVHFSNPPYNYLWSSPSVGDYALTAVATDNDGASVTSAVVNVYVRANVPASVAITSPQENETVQLANVSVTVDAQDPDGSVALVEFFVDESKVGSDSSSPFTLTINLASGTHTLVASAIDNFGSTSFSTPVHVLASAPPSSLLRGPYLQSCTQTSIVVRWRTDVANQGVVQFGTSAASLVNVATEPFATTEHAVFLTGLSADTRYFYSIGDAQGMLVSGPTYFFLTTPALPKPTRIWVIGDFGTGGNSQKAVRDAYAAFAGPRYTDVWLMLGDNAYGSGSDSEYQSAVFDIYPQLLRQSCVWPTIGNHDFASGPRGHVYTDIFSLPSNGEAGGVPSGTERYYSYDYGGIHFVVLDSTFSSRAPGSPMFTWLEQDLAARTKTWTIAFWHHPPYTRGTHNSETESDLIQMRENALPILEAHNVDLVLCGHSHVYERSYLLNGHYGYMASFSPAMKVDGGTGRTNETGAYQKTDGSNRGTVYAVVGCSGQVGGGILDHPAFFRSIGGVGGSLVVDVDGERLDAQFLTGNGISMDSFTLLKPSDGPTLRIVRSPTAAIISWPLSATNFVLESTLSLNEPASWTGITNSVFQQGDQNVVFIFYDVADRYFRLRK
jgi:hypothetical protein